MQAIILHTHKHKSRELEWSGAPGTRTGPLWDAGGSGEGLADYTVVPALKVVYFYKLGYFVVVCLNRHVSLVLNRLILFLLLFYVNNRQVI